MTNEAGSIVEGTIVDIQKFGAFVKIRGGRTGLIHISQISDKFVREVSDHVTVGARVIAKIILVDSKGRVQLSLKSVTPEEAAGFQSEETPEDTAIQIEREAAPPPPRREPPPPAFNRERERDRFRDQDRAGGPEDDFERKLKHFLRQSEDRLVDLKRNVDAKRGAKKKKK
jgi:S1 RNA binding domain protein